MYRCETKRNQKHTTQVFHVTVITEVQLYDSNEHMATDTNVMATLFLQNEIKGDS